MKKSSQKPVLSTMWSGGARWNALVDVAPFVDVGGPRDLARLLRESRRHEAVVLLGSASADMRYRDLVLAVLLARLPRRPRVLITDATWEPRSRKIEARLPFLGRLVPPLARLLIKAMDGPHVRFCVLSTDELETFPRTWGISKDRVVFTPFPATMSTSTPTSDEGYLFAGGNSLRDYELLEEALEGTDIPTRIAARWQPRRDLANVEVQTLPHDGFVAAMAASHAVVVPLAETVRSAGQQTYLNAMALGKPVVVTESPGVRDYVRHGETGIIVPARADALREALEHVFDPSNADLYREMGERARLTVEKECHIDRNYYDGAVLGALGYGAEQGTDRASHTPGRRR